MDNSKIDSNIKQILDLRTNKGVFPLSSESAIIAHSPNGEMTYLDSVIDYLYQQIAYKIRLYTEQDGNNTKGKAYPAAMGLRDSNNITSLQNSINNYVSLLNSLQQQINNIDQTSTITSLNTIVEQLQEEFDSLMVACEYSYQEIKFSDSATRPPGNLDDTTYWKNTPLTNFDHLWLGIRTVTVRRGQNGEAIVTKGPVTVVSLQGPKGEKGDRGEPGPPGASGATGQNGDSYRPVLMYKWTASRTPAPATPTDTLNQGWSENPGTPEENNKYLWMTQNYIRMSDNTYLNQQWSTPICLSGEDGNSASQGVNGAVVRFRGEYTQGESYINSSLNTSLSSTALRYIDVVMVIEGQNKTYYMVKPLTDSTRTVTNISPTDIGQTVWQEATGFSFIAAEALYAQDAHINDLSTYEFVVQDGANHIVAGMTGGNISDSVVSSNNNINPVRIWAGSNTGSNINLQDDAIPFKVFQNGRLKATNAQIKGDLSLDSLSLTGNQGSYYYNEEQITLPQITSSKHTVTFIITTFNATEVNAHYGDVLFALSNNNITTTSSTVALDKYKIYLAISVNDGGTNGWLIQNLNSLQISNNYTNNLYSSIISENSSNWNVYNEGQDTSNGSIPVIKLLKDKELCEFETTNTSMYSNVTNKKFSLGGKIYCKYGNNIIATITIPPKNITSIGNNYLNSTLSGTVTIEDIIRKYNTEEITVETLNQVNAPITYIDSPDYTYLQVSWGDTVNIPTADTINIEPHISLTESFTYELQSTNNTATITTDVVGQNGLVIKNGSIVATDMPEGASVNMKDCIVYKDVTETAANEHYEVINFGANNVTIGNTILSPNSAILVKAQPNIQIDFSDVAAIDASDIYDIDPLQYVDPVNH